MDNKKNLKFILNDMPKYKMSILGSFKLFTKLLFISFKKYKITKKVLFLEIATISSFALVFTSSLYVINSSNITMGDYLYPIKTNLQNIVSSTKISNLSKIKYYNNLINQRLEEIKNIQKQNLNKTAESNPIKVSLVNIAYAAEVKNINNINTSKTAISETIIEIKNLKDKTITEIKKIKNQDDLKKALDIFNNTINKEISVLEDLARTSISKDQNTKEIKDIINTTSRALDIAYQNKDQIDSINNKINTKKSSEDMSEIKIDLTTDILENSLLDSKNKEEVKKYIEEINAEKINLKDTLLKKGFSEKTSENIMTIIENKLIDSEYKHNNGKDQSAVKDLKDAEFIMKNPGIFDKNIKNKK